MSARRVVITGLGVVSNIGVGCDAFKDALRAGRSVVTPIQSFETDGYPYAHATEIQDLGEAKEAYSELAGKHGRSTIFAMLASREAVGRAGLSRQDLQVANAGAIVGTTNGESQELQSIVKQWVTDGPGAVDSSDWQRVLAHRIPLGIAKDLDLPGEALTIGTACAAGNYAIGHAADIIHAGEADVMLCGGADSVCRATYTAFFRLGAITPDVCRPFDVGRKGILTGEGSAMLVLESLDHALARGAKIYAEVLGYATNCDANHMVAPEQSSIAECLRRAHKRAGITPEQVDFISAHGTGTRTNDVVEVGAIKEVFGDQPPPTVSIKSMLGHTMGAASAMGAVACVLALENDFIPPTANFNEADPQCDIDCVPNVYRQANLSIVENHGFAFCGNNAILILKNGREVARETHQGVH